MHAITDDTFLRYRIDPHDILMSVSAKWDDVATEAGSAHLHGHAILGQPLWRFIGDVGTSEIYRHILTRVRSGPAVALTLRCDTPDMRRTIELHMSAAADGSVNFASRIVAAEVRAYQAMLDVRTPRSAELLHVCGWCKKFQVQGRWIEVEDAVSTLGLFDDAICPRMSHGICDPCLVRFTA